MTHFLVYNQYNIDDKDLINMGLFRKKALKVNSEKYSQTEKEITVLTMGTPEKIPGTDKKIQLCYMPLVGYIDGEEVCINASGLHWYCKSGKSCNPFKLRNEHAYVLKVRPSLACAENDRSIREGRNLLVTKVVSRKVKDSRIDSLLDAFKKDIKLTLTDGTELTLNKKTGEFFGESESLGGFSIMIDSCGGKEQLDKNVNYVNLVIALGDSWLNVAKDYIFKNEFDNASEWCEDELTEEQFKNRISLADISVYDDGTYWVFFDDDGIFLEHSIVIRGEIGKGFNEVTLMG